MSFQYQTFGDAPGMVDSLAKLRALQLPPMVGKSFLDVGCNEGYNCGAALRAGAARVVGLDSSSEFIARARNRFPSAEFVNQSWSNLPSGLFDVVLYSSTMHYISTIEETVSMLRRLAKSLAPDGLLILEVGISPETGFALHPVVRPDGSEVHYPNEKLLDWMLAEADLSYRFASYSISGDRIQRHVYHCRRLKPAVMFVRGAAHVGKSQMSLSLAGGSRGNVINIDVLSRELIEKMNVATLSDRRYEVEAKREVLGLGSDGEDAMVGALVNEIRRKVAAQSPENKGQAIIVDGLDPNREADNRVFKSIVQRLSQEFVIWDSFSVTTIEPNWWYDSERKYFDAGGYLLPVRFTGRTAAVSEVVVDDDHLEMRLANSGRVTVPLNATFVVNGATVGPFPVVEEDSGFKVRAPAAKFPSPLDGNVVHVALEMSDKTVTFADRPTGDRWPFRSTKDGG